MQSHCWLLNIYTYVQNCASTVTPNSITALYKFCFIIIIIIIIIITLFTRQLVGRTAGYPFVDKFHMIVPVENIWNCIVSLSKVLSQP